MIVIVAIALNLANVIGYTKCEKDAKKNLTSMASKFVGQQLLSRAGASLFGGSSTSQA